MSFAPVSSKKPILSLSVTIGMNSLLNGFDLLMLSMLPAPLYTKGLRWLVCNVYEAISKIEITTDTGYLLSLSKNI